jgi:MFS family permease
VLVGLMMGLFATVSSAMIVTNALPAIASGLGTTSDGALWVVLASLVTMTVATPIWGKLADHRDKKRLTQAAILIFVLGSAGAALAPDLGTLVAMRAIQGVSTGGLLAMAQAVLGAITSPRQRGAYSGYLGAVMSVATLCGPLIGGVIVDAPGLGWRWCFVLLLPLAIAALVIVQVTLRVPHVRGPLRIDAAGSVLLAFSATALVSLLTLGGRAFAWASVPSGVLLAVAVVSAVAFVLVERRAADPVLAPRLLREHGPRWAIVGSAALGIVTFSSILYLSQYLQLVREHSASMAGALAAPMLTATMAGAIGGGHLVARSGRLTAVLITGSALLIAGFAVLATIGDATLDALVVAGTIPVGLGVGLLMQNYVLAAQNAVDRSWVGRVSGAVSLFRSLAGAVGVAGLGAVVAVAGGGASATGAVYAVSAAAALLTLVASIALGRQELRTTL